MEKEKIIDNYKLEEKLNKFCKENNLCKELFEIARVGNCNGSGERKVLRGPSNVKNKNCTYVVKLFLKYNIIIIWNYKNNHSMSYSYITIQNKLNKGIFWADKGRITHTNNQSEILFEHTENFELLLNRIANKI